MRKNLCLLLVVTLAFTAGCDRLKGDDPVAKLKSHAACLEKHLREQESKEANPRMIEDVSFDVRKTDSLTSPFMGFIQWAEKDKSVDSCHEFKMVLAYQENQWVLKEVQWRTASNREWSDFIDELARTGAFLAEAAREKPTAELTDKGTILRDWSKKLVCN
jgi:hypothetical protein